VADFVKYARQCDIPVGPGRGSCAGSLLAYVLGITGVDPLKYGLIFERFLNPERVSPPDFDIDFCQKRRGEVIEYLRQRYGPDQVAHIVTFATFGARTAIRDVGRVLEIPGAECERLVKMVIEAEEGLHTPLPRILERHPALRRDYTTAGSAAQRILTQALLLEGLNRNAGTHAAGVVIGPGPLVEWTPLTRDREGHVLTQYAMESVRAVGLLKIDLLGLKTLTVLQNAAHLIARQRGAPLILDALPLDDKPTYALLTRGDTTGIFQVESEGMRDLIRRVGVDSITELMALIALYRPGPMSMLEEFIRRKTGQAPATFEHPALKPVLSETHGVMIYQEQVLLAAQALAGYTLGEADLLRYAMTKKNAALMAAQQARFAAGCMRHHRIAAPEAQRLFEVLARFAAYGFNKSHSAAYALMTYQTAFLKANYPVEFMAAVLTGEMGNFGRLPTLVRATEAMEIEVLPPDVNQSATAFLPAGSAIRFGLAGVKNVGELSASQIAAERERQGPYRDPLDFCVRLEGSAVNRRVVESLIRCGALDTLGYHRARVWRSLEGLWTRAGEIARERRSGQRRLFEWAAPVADLLPDCEPWPQSRMLADEKELLGIYRNGHPLRTYAWLLEHYRLTTVHQLQSLPEGAPIYLGGLIVAVERRRSAADSAPFAEVQVEDLDGTADVLAPPDVFRRYAALLAPDSAILLCGVVSHAVGTHVILNEAHPLTTAAQRLAARVSLHLSAAEMGNEVLDRVRDLLRQHPGPTPVTLRIEFPNSEKVLIEMGGDFRVTADEALFHAFEHVLGEGAVYIEVKHPACAPTDAPHSSTNESGD
jgi:DNA polymerase-3 subunit alpha